MVKAVLKFIFPALLAVSCAQYKAPVFSWEKFDMDGHRVGAGVSRADNVQEALGVYENGIYTAPNGKVFSDGCTPSVAKALIDVQPSMARLKQVVGISTRVMKNAKPESELSNWEVDVVSRETERLFGEKVDFGITNFGGIRADIPEGEVMLDDIESMFPFKNYLCYVKIKGTRVKEIFDSFAANKIHCVSGVKLVIDGRKVKELLIGGEPLDLDREYGMATINFLLDGGDGLFLAEDALELKMSDVLVRDAILNDMKERQRDGRPLEYFKDGRVQIINREGK